MVLIPSNQLLDRIGLGDRNGDGMREDAAGHPVSFTLMYNADNKLRGDVALFSVEGMSWTGAESDPVAAVVHCSPARVWSLLVEGRAVVEGGHLVNADEDALAREGRRLGQRMAKGS